jgi:hypothetical protein
MRRNLAIASALGTAAAGGILAAWVLVKLPSAPKHRGEDLASRNSAPENDVSRVASVERDVLNLEAELGKLRASASETHLVDAAPVTAPSSSPVQEDPAVAREREVNAFHADLARHAAEGVDSKWASVAASSLTKDFVALAPAGHFKLKSVDCRTTTCVANVEFDTYGAAMRGWQQILLTPFRTGCGVEILLDEQPRDPSLPYQANSLFDCEAVRAAGFN